MGAVIGETLSLALGVAISPIPIIAAILMLLSPKARITSVGFLIGWVLGIVLGVTVFTLLSGILPSAGAEGPQPIKGVIQLILGALLLLLAAVRWRSHAGAEPALPGWMQAIDKVTFIGALGLGLLLSAANPKNLILAAAAGVGIGAAPLTAAEIVLVIAIFTVIAASTVLIPVVGFLIAAQRLRAPLDALRVWLVKENAVIMAVLLLVIGVSMVGKGIGSF